MKKSFFILIFFITPFIGKSQTLGTVCKTISIYYDPYYNGLNCPIRICIKQRLECVPNPNNPPPEGSDECPEFGTDIVNCITLSPNDTFGTLCYKIITTSSPYCDCELITTKVSFERLKIEESGQFSVVDSFVFTSTGLINEFMNYLNGTHTDMSIDFTKNCNGGTTGTTGIRLFGTGDPNYPFIVLVP